MTCSAPIRSLLWLGLLAAAAWLGTDSAPMWETVLSPAQGLERGVIELFGADVQWAGWLVAVPVTWWATGKRVELGLAVAAGLFASGHGLDAVSFFFACVGVGLFLELDDDERWQGEALSAAAAMLAFAFMNPWAAAIGGGIVLATHAVRKTVALPTMIVFFPSVVAALLVLVFFVGDGPSLVDGVVATGVVCLSTPVLALGVGVAAFLLSLSAVHPTAQLAHSVGVSVVDAPIEIAPELLANGLTVRSGARFALVQSVAEGEVEIAETDGWTLVDRADIG